MIDIEKLLTNERKREPIELLENRTLDSDLETEIKNAHLLGVVELALENANCPKYDDHGRYSAKKVDGPPGILVNFTPFDNVPEYIKFFARNSTDHKPLSMGSDPNDILEWKKAVVRKLDWPLVLQLAFLTLLKPPVCWRSSTAEEKIFTLFKDALGINYDENASSKVKFFLEHKRVQKWLVQMQQLLEGWGVKLNLDEFKLKPSESSLQISQIGFLRTTEKFSKDTEPFNLEDKRNTF